MPWHVVLLKGIGANWLVCLAVWLGMCSRGAAGKILGLWFPVMCFVAIGYEHSIANMFFIPLGMMQGAEVGWGEFIGRNLIPATLGNVAGGAVFVGGLYWYVYGTGKAKEQPAPKFPKTRTQTCSRNKTSGEDSAERPPAARTGKKIPPLPARTLPGRKARAPHPLPGTALSISTAGHSYRPTLEQ